MRAAADQGTKALAAGTPGIAAQAARLGEDGLAQGAAFLDAIDHLAVELEEARTKVDAELAAAERTWRRPRRPRLACRRIRDVTRRLAEAAQLLTDARTALDPPKPDVSGAYDKARKANALADAIEQGIRTAHGATGARGRPTPGRTPGGPGGGDPRLGLREWASRRHRDRGTDPPGRGDPAPRPGQRAERHGSGRRRSPRPTRRPGSRRRRSRSRSRTTAAGTTRSAVEAAGAGAAGWRDIGGAGDHRRASSAACCRAAGAGAGVVAFGGGVRRRRRRLRRVRRRRRAAGASAEAAAPPEAAVGDPALGPAAVGCWPTHTAPFDGSSGRSKAMTTDPRHDAEISARNSTEGSTPWPNPRSSDASASSSGPMSTR